MIKNLKQKFSKTFKMNPLYEADSYKLGHKPMLAKGTTREYYTWIPRSLKYFPKGIVKILSGGQCLTWAHIHSHFQENFFDVEKEVALKFIKDACLHLNQNYNGKHFEELYDLGYLPIHVQALPEGIFTKANIPHMTGITTGTTFAWLGLFLETYISKTSWQLPTAATLAYEFRKCAYKGAMDTNPECISPEFDLTRFLCHDFHSRGGNSETSILVGLGHSFSNWGSDTLNVIPASRYYYGVGEEEMPIYSVNASEHSVTCTGIFFYEKRLKAGKLNREIREYYSFDVPCEGSVEKPDYRAIAEWLNLRDWIKKFPSGILSVVADTFNLWKLITYILPRLKKEILNRDEGAKFVVRPDSGNPADILCGLNSKDLSDILNYSDEEVRGVVEILGDIFGTTESSTGYKLLNTKVGAIYGDSINLDRQKEIYSRLKSKGFATTNTVLGIGSYTYVYQTRDTAGFAAKGAWFETEELTESGEKLKSSFDIYKDPITDDGTKKSLKGFQFVYIDPADGEIKCESGVSEEKAFSEENLLKTIYKNGDFFNYPSLDEIRGRIEDQLVEDCKSM